MWTSWGHNGDIRERTCIGHHRTPAQPDTPPQGTVPSGHRAIAPPGRRHEATRHHTEKDCGERRKDRRMRHEGRRHNAIRHGPSCLGSPPPVVPPLPTARRASAPHRPSCAMVWHPERPSPAKPRPNIRLSPTPPTAALRTYFRLYAVALP